VTKSTKRKSAGSARVLWLVLVTMSLASSKLLAKAGAFPALSKNIDQRPLMDSDGCVVVDNYSFDRLGDYIQTGATYILVSEDDIQWESADTFAHQETSLSAAFEQ